ncbi:MAG: hypothetical protein V7637_4331 [Mycobacteriales bacterium]
MKIRTILLAAALALGTVTAASAPAAAAPRNSAVTPFSTVVVPNVIGLGEVQAINVLVGAGLGTPIRHGVFTCDFSTNTVIDQNPGSNTVVPAGTVVTLTIARFPPRGCL